MEEEKEKGKVQKVANKSGALGTRTVGDTMDTGPTYVITVPESYEQTEMEEVLDLVLAAPDTSIGTAIVVREGVCFNRIDDGHRGPRVKKMVEYDDEPDEETVFNDEGWGD
jgi:hypothetical protein